MKIKIKYELDTTEPPFLAKTRVDDKFFCSYGSSWEKAKEILIDKIKDYNELNNPPQPEEIEI